MSKQTAMTAVEWLQDLFEEQDYLTEQDFEHAEKMFKQQIIDAYDLGMGHYGDANRRSDAEQYYNETFNK
jgi:hypothetical protein